SSGSDATGSDGTSSEDGNDSVTSSDGSSSVTDAGGGSAPDGRTASNDGGGTGGPTITGMQILVTIQNSPMASLNGQVVQFGTSESARMRVGVPFISIWGGAPYGPGATPTSQITLSLMNFSTTPRTYHCEDNSAMLEWSPLPSTAI